MDNSCMAFTAKPYKRVLPLVCSGCKSVIKRKAENDLWSNQWNMVLIDEEKINET